MKLIIDIDEQTYNKARIYITELEIKDILIVRKAIRKGVKLETELEEIKAEAEELIEHCDSDYDFEEIYGIRLVVGILDNRLSELKGENNG